MMIGIIVRVDVATGKIIKAYREIDGILVKLEKDMIDREDQVSIEKDEPQEADTILKQMIAEVSDRNEALIVAGEQAADEDFSREAPETEEVLLKKQI